MKTKSDHYNNTLTVWEAVGELNARSTLGRAIVNPPERKSKIKPRATKDVWHLCNCGRAFSNYPKYNEHQLEHQRINFKQTWLSPRIKSPDESSNDKKVSSNSSGTFVIEPKPPKSPLAKFTKISRTIVRSSVYLEKNVSNKRLRSSTGNVENKEDGKRTRLDNHLVNQEEKRVKESQEVHRRQKVVQIAKREKIKCAPNDKATRKSDIFYDAVGTRTRSTINNDNISSSPPPAVSSPKQIMQLMQPEIPQPEVKIMNQTENVITVRQLKLIFDCEKCGLPFKTARGLSQHDKWYHAQPPVEISCKICPAKFTTENDLQKHMVNHSIKLMYKKYKFGSGSSRPVTISPRTRHRNGSKINRPAVVNDNYKNKAVKTQSDRIQGRGDKCGYCGQLFYDRKALWPHLTECRGTLNN